MKPRKTTELCRLFISSHLFAELEGLIAEFDVCAPSYISFPVEGPNGTVLLRFALTGKDLKGFKCEYKYRGEN